MRNGKIRNWILKRAVLGLAVAALVAPAAAQGARGGGVTGDAGVVTRLVGPHQQPALPCAPNCGFDQQVGVETPSGSGPQVVSSTGFDWRDAGIGAGIALGFVLLGGAAFRVTSHLGKAQTA
jgi:hypothetical protein